MSSFCEWRFQFILEHPVVGCFFFSVGLQNKLRVENVERNNCILRDANRHKRKQEELEKREDPKIALQKLFLSAFLQNGIDLELERGSGDFCCQTSQGIFTDILVASVPDILAWVLLRYCRVKNWDASLRTAVIWDVRRPHFMTDLNAFRWLIPGVELVPREQLVLWHRVRRWRPAVGLLNYFVIAWYLSALLDPGFQLIELC